MFLDGMEFFGFIVCTVGFCVVGGLLVHFAFGGKKENKKKNDKLFETTAFLRSKAPWGMLAPRDPSDREES